MISFLYKKKQYLGASGDGAFFEVFDVSQLEENKFLSNNFASFAFCLLLFLWKPSNFLWKSEFHKKSYYYKIYLFIFCLVFEDNPWLLEPIKQVKLGNMKNFLIKLQNGKLFAVEYSGFE